MGSSLWRGGPEGVSSAERICYAPGEMVATSAGEGSAGSLTLSGSCPACALQHPAGVPCPVATQLLMRAEGQILPAGTLLADRFEIAEVTHRSGMSTIYRACDTRDNDRPVAVKQVSVDGLAGCDRQEAGAWLAREAGLLSSLQSPHLPELLAAFSEGDSNYVVMPFLEGETVKELVEAGDADSAVLSRRWALAVAQPPRRGDLVERYRAPRHVHAAPVVPGPAAPRLRLRSAEPHAATRRRCG